ncbi:hypothetical protein D3C71_1658060 [compost metagenome]
MGKLEYGQGRLAGLGLDPDGDQHWLMGVVLLGGMLLRLNAWGRIFLGSVETRLNLLFNSAVKARRVWGC